MRVLLVQTDRDEFRITIPDNWKGDERLAELPAAPAQRRRHSR